MGPVTKPSTRATLSTDQIVDAALALIAKEGVDRLSMRQLSAELGASLGATYRHVPTKDALLALCGRALYERSYHPRDAHDDPLHWVREQVMHLYDLLVEHPGMASRVVFTGNVDPQLSEDVRASLVQAGHAEDSVEMIGLVLTLYTAGALMASSQPTDGRTDDLDTRSLIVSGLDFILHSYVATGGHPKLTTRSGASAGPPAKAAKTASTTGARPKKTPSKKAPRKAGGAHEKQPAAEEPGRKGSAAGAKKAASAKVAARRR